MTVKSVLLPDIGNFKDLPVIEVLVAEGDRIEADQSLITLESDKATMEIPAPFAGTVKKVLVKTDDTVNVGDIIAEIDTDDASASPEPESQQEPESTAKPVKPTSATVSAPAPEPIALPVTAPAETPVAAPVNTKSPAETSAYPINAPTPGARFHASPAVRAFARTLGVDLTHVTGTGVKGRIQKTDVTAFVKATLSQAASAAPTAGSSIPSLPSIDFSQFGEIETVPLTRIQKRSGKHLSACWLNIPHVTQFDETDITDLEAFRQSLKARAEKAGVKLTPLVFILKAAARVLADHPKFNASLDATGENLILKQYIHIGVAVDTPNGLVVPVVHDVDKKGLFELSAELAEVSARARDGKLSPDDLSGGCFSISSLGGIGGTQFTPIVNGPEVAILGVSRAQMRPVWNGETFKPRLMLPLALSYDHRVIDGALGARFITALSAVLSDLRELIL